MTAAQEEAAQKKDPRLGQQVRSAWVRDLDRFLTDVDSVVVAQVERVATRDLNQLRQMLEPVEGTLHMVKNSLCRIAFRNRGLEGLDSLLEGTCAITPIRGDVAMACKLLAQFSKSHEGFVLRGGLLENQLRGSKDLAAAAQLPARPVLISQLAGLLQLPVRNLALTLQASLRQLAWALQGVEGKKGKPKGEE